MMGLMEMGDGLYLTQMARGMTIRRLYAALSLDSTFASSSSRQSDSEVSGSIITCQERGNEACVIEQMNCTTLDRSVIEIEWW